MTLGPPHTDSSPALLVVAGPVDDQDDVRALCEQLGAVMAGCAAATVVCDVYALPPDARALEALARLQLTARRAQRRIRLQRASRELLQLLEFAGLAEVIPYELAIVERQRQAEQREDPPDVEEAVDRGDPPV